MPEQVADDLAPQDLAQMEGALSVTTQVSQHPFHEGRPEYYMVGTERRYNTVYDVKELRMSNIAVELPGTMWEDAGEGRSAQHFAITLLDALCSALS